MPDAYQSSHFQIWTVSIFGNVMIHMHQAIVSDFDLIIIFAEDSYPIFVSLLFIMKKTFNFILHG